MSRGRGQADSSVGRLPFVRADANVCFPFVSGVSLVRSFALASCLLVYFVPVLQAQDTTTAPPAHLTWGSAPTVFPTGTKMAVVRGDPSQS
jgi:hypothetical protein